MMILLLLGVMGTAGVLIGVRLRGPQQKREQRAYLTDRERTDYPLKYICGDNTVTIRSEDVVISGKASRTSSLKDVCLVSARPHGEAILWKISYLRGGATREVEFLEQGQARLAMCVLAYKAGVERSA